MKLARKANGRYLAAETWERALEAYRYRVDLTNFRDAQKHPGWFDRSLDPGNRSQTMRFKDHFRENALDNLEA